MSERKKHENRYYPNEQNTSTMVIQLKLRNRAPALSKVRKNINAKLPFIARLAIAPAATLRTVSSSKLLRSISKEVRPPASTIFFWLASAFCMGEHIIFNNKFEKKKKERKTRNASKNE
jgi:hypothetical protein